MIISSGDVEPRIVDDYDIIFVNGVVWPVTIDGQAGDSIDFKEDRIIVSIASRKSPTDFNAMTVPEEQTIYKQNICIVNHRKRVLIPPSPEQRNEMSEFIKQKVSKTIH